MKELSKAIKRRFYNGKFLNQYFVGNGIDIGGKPDPLNEYLHVFPLMSNVDIWDIEDGDAEFMETIQDNIYDFIHSSHCLEHTRNPEQALFNWIRIVKNNGYLIITVPDEDLYEQKIWPSNKNTDHKHTFTIYKQKSWSPNSINLLDLLKKFNNIEIEKIELINEFFNFNKNYSYYNDQTLLPNTESCIEIILKKKKC